MEKNLNIRWSLGVDKGLGALLHVRMLHLLEALAIMRLVP